MFACRPHARGERGASAIEFALVFPLFFFIFYGIVNYGLIFMLSISMTLAAEEGARAAVATDMQNPDRDTLVETRARAAVLDTLEWLPADWHARILGDDSGSAVQVEIEEDASRDWVVNVTVEYPSYRTQPILPLLRFPDILGITEIPPVPSRLAGRATARL